MKQAPRSWYNCNDTYLQSNNFQRCSNEQALCIKQQDGDLLLISLYVDDLIFMGNDSPLIDESKSCMISELKITDMGLMSYYLVIEVGEKEDGSWNHYLSK